MKNPFRTGIHNINKHAHLFYIVFVHILSHSGGSGVRPGRDIVAVVVATRQCRLVWAVGMWRSMTAKFENQTQRKMYMPHSCLHKHRHLAAMIVARQKWNMLAISFFPTHNLKFTKCTFDNRRLPPSIQKRFQPNHHSNSNEKSKMARKHLGGKRISILRNVSLIAPLSFV